MVADIIQPSEIQSELTRIWDSLEGTNKIRASLFNLIVFTKKTARAEYIQTISQKVIEKFPSRVILITADTESSEDYLNTRVSVLSSNKQENDIACDFIQIDVSGKLQERVPFVILPQIVADLPIYVIWSEDTFEPSPLFTELKKMATRMIFDSEQTESLPQFAESLVDFEKKFQFEIADLNWARTENWRKLLASTFYTEERLARLNQSTHIQILFNNEKPPFICDPRIQAFYLQGWLATQLKWELENMKVDKEKITLTYQRPGGKVKVDLYPEQHQTLKSGAIISVDIETEDKEHFSFGRNLEMPHTVSMRFSTLQQCDVPLQYLFPKDETGQSLIKEISHKGTSSHYMNLLHQIKNQKGYSLGEH